MIHNVPLFIIHIIYSKPLPTFQSFHMKNVLCLHHSDDSWRMLCPLFAKHFDSHDLKFQWNASNLKYRGLRLSANIEKHCIEHEVRTLVV